MSAHNEIGASAPDPCRPVAGPTISAGVTVEGVSSLPNSAAGSQGPAVLLGKRKPRVATGKRMFSEAEDEILHQVHRGEIGATRAREILFTSHKIVVRRYIELFGEQPANPNRYKRRRVHVFSEADRPILRRYSENTVAMSVLREMFGASTRTIVRAMADLGISMPDKRISPTNMPPEKLRDGVWVPIAHKSDRRWVALDGAPVTIGEAHALERAGKAFVMQRRVDGGWDLEVRMRK